MRFMGSEGLCAIISPATKEPSSSGKIYCCHSKIHATLQMWVAAGVLALICIMHNARDPLPWPASLG